MPEKNNIYKCLNDSYLSTIQYDLQKWRILAYQLTVISAFTYVIMSTWKNSIVIPLYIYIDTFHSLLRISFFAFCFLTITSCIYILFQIISFLNNPVIHITPDYHLISDNIYKSNLDNITYEGTKILSKTISINTSNIINQRNKIYKVWEFIVYTTVAFIVYLILYCMWVAK